MNIKEMNYPFDVGVLNSIKRKGIKQAYVADKAGYTRQELNDMLNGRRLIKARDVLNLSLALGITADDIYKAGKDSEDARQEDAPGGLQEG